MLKVKCILGFIVRFALIGLLTVMVTCFDAQASTNTEELQRKIADISLLKQQLQDRKQQAESALETLLRQQKEIVAEVHVLLKSLNISSFDEAQQHLRLRYDIELLRTITAYRQGFETKIRFYQNGRDKLAYLQQLAEDDTRMITTLSDFQIDALATQISLVINQYLKEAHNIQIDLQNIEMSSGQSVWDTITGNKH